MKLRLATLLIVLLHSISIFSQDNKTVSIEKNRFNLVEEMTLKDQMLDPVFYMGKVIFKDGTHTETYLNYNLLTNGIYFLDNDNNAYQLAGLPEIAAISYGKRTFIPINSKEIAEVIQSLTGGDELLLNRKTEIKSSADNRGAYGASTITSSVARINTWDDAGAYKQIDRSINVDITLKKMYLIKKGNKIININRMRDLRKLYPDKWESLKDFVQTNNLKFNRQDDVIKIISFCYE